jgi:NAD+ synthase (glutamine-hydrolysing)
MKLIRVAAAVLNQTPLDWSGNEARIRKAIQDARAQDTSILCLPELCITGYGCEDAFHSAGIQGTALQVLERLLPETKGMLVSLGLPLMFQNALFNVVCMVADGRILGFVAKRFLAGDGIHYEPRWFKPWPAQVRSTVQVFGKAFPIGDLLFELGDVRIGLEICEDAWVAARPGAALALQGVDIILNPSASHFAFGKIRVRERFVLEGSRAFNASYVYSNLLGNESGRAIYDGGAMIASGGALLAKGPRFSYRDVIVTSAVIDVAATRINQARTGSYHSAVNALSDAFSNFKYPEFFITYFGEKAVDFAITGENPFKVRWFSKKESKEVKLPAAPQPPQGIISPDGAESVGRAIERTLAALEKTTGPIRVILESTELKAIVERPAA